jgi:hypothetical protein
MRRRRVPPKDTDHAERCRLLGERLGIPYPGHLVDPPLGKDGPELIFHKPAGKPLEAIRPRTSKQAKRYVQWVFQVGLALMDEQPEFRQGQGRRVGSRTGPRSTVKETRKKYAQRERQVQRKEARVLELMHKLGEEQSWREWREFFDCDEDAKDFVDGMRKGSWWTITGTEGGH